MKVYLVRDMSDKQFYGIFCAPSRADLFWLIDEFTDPGSMEFITLLSGGIYNTNRHSGTVPCPREIWEDETQEAEERFKDWGARLLADLNFTEGWDYELMDSKETWLPLVPDEVTLSGFYNS